MTGDTKMDEMAQEYEKQGAPYRLAANILQTIGNFQEEISNAGIMMALAAALSEVTDVYVVNPEQTIDIICATAKRMHTALRTMKDGGDGNDICKKRG